MGYDDGDFDKNADDYWDPMDLGGDTAEDKGGYTPLPATQDEPSEPGIFKGVGNADFDAIFRKVADRLTKVTPWKELQAATPDLGWHTPTCGSRDWKHIDVKLEISNGIMYIIYNRPNENNSLQDTIGQGTNDAIFACHERKDIRFAVWTGEGRMYCAGGDPKAWQAQAGALKGTLGEWDWQAGDGTVGNRIMCKQPSEEVIHHCTRLAERAAAAGAFPDGRVDVDRLKVAKQWNTWMQSPQFSTALANGSAMGGGVGCVCCCDMVISVKRAYFVLSEVKIGVIPATISPYVVAKIGTAACKRLMCTGEQLTATRAQDIGMVDFVVDNVKEGHKIVKEIADKISMCASKAVDTGKQMVVACVGQPLTETLLFEALKVELAVNSAEEAVIGRKCKAQGKETPWASDPMKVLY